MDQQAPASVLDLADAERVLQAVAAEARTRHGARLEATYAIGSLAHGGFAPAVSDVDVALVLAEPVRPDDLEAIEGLVSRVRTSGLRFADRLSVFFASSPALADGRDDGRFPAIDRLDLAVHGRMLTGKDVRGRVRRPSYRELVRDSVAHAVRQMQAADEAGYFASPASLARAGVKRLTKVVLLPVRCRYTIATGSIGRNDDAVRRHLAQHDAIARGLVDAAFRWRFSPPNGGDPQVAAQLEADLRPLYASCTTEIAAGARAAGALASAIELDRWRARWS